MAPFCGMVCVYLGFFFSFRFPALAVRLRKNLSLGVSFCSGPGKVSLIRYPGTTRCCCHPQPCRKFFSGKGRGGPASGHPGIRSRHLLATHENLHSLSAAGMPVPQVTAFFLSLPLVLKNRADFWQSARFCVVMDFLGCNNRRMLTPSPTGCRLTGLCLLAVYAASRLFFFFRNRSLPFRAEMSSPQTQGKSPPSGFPRSSRDPSAPEATNPFCSTRPVRWSLCIWQ